MTGGDGRMTITDRAATSERLYAAVAFITNGMSPSDALSHAGGSVDEFRDADDIGMPEANTFRVAVSQRGYDDWLIQNGL
jgi:hypothetical protein